MPGSPQRWMNLGITSRGLRMGSPGLQMSSDDPANTRSVSYTREVRGPCLDELDPNELLRIKEEVIRDQAARGQQPGLMMMEDRTSGRRVMDHWGVKEGEAEMAKEDALAAEAMAKSADKDMCVASAETSIGAISEDTDRERKCIHRKKQNAHNEDNATVDMGDSTGYLGGI